MARFYYLTMCSFNILQSLVSASSSGCLNEMCSLLCVNLTSEQVALDLGPQLSAASSIFGNSDPRWIAATERYDPYMQPSIQIVIEPGNEYDIPKIVSIRCFLAFCS